MFRPMIRLLSTTLLSAILAAGCGDAAPTATERVEPPTSEPALEVSIFTAENIAGQYDERQPLAPFGITEWEFNEDPELVSDEQFTQQGEATLTDWEAYQIEADAIQIEDHVNNCSGYHSSGGGGGGSPDPFLSASSYDRCEALYKSCSNRCRRIRNPKGKAACWIACMAAFAICRANK